jgi:hypothetical protein
VSSKQKKTRSKKYDPQKTFKKLLKLRASKCYLYSWLSGGNAYGDFLGYGPYPPQQVVEALHWAIHRPQPWSAVVIACFIGENNHYYEEMRYIPAEGETMLDKPEHCVKLDAKIRVHREEVAKAGNPKHLVDVVTFLRIHTEEFDTRVESDEWLLKQSAHRAKAMFEHRRQQEIDRLEALCEAVA